jgi:tetratricopeptide (TPR) repeat protein
MEEILKIDPEDLNLRSQVGNAWFIWGNPAPHGNSCDRADGVKKAIPHYEIIVKAYPSNTSFLLALGKCYQALEDSKHARVYYDKVIEIDGTKGNAVTAKALIRNMDMADQNRSKQAGK